MTKICCHDHSSLYDNNLPGWAVPFLAAFHPLVSSGANVLLDEQIASSEKHAGQSMSIHQGNDTQHL